MKKQAILFSMLLTSAIALAVPSYADDSSEAAGTETPAPTKETNESLLDEATKLGVLDEKAELGVDYDLRRTETGEIVRDYELKEESEITPGK